MTFTAKNTATAIRQELKPILVAAGFDDWTTKKAWRRRQNAIDTIEFRSFNEYTASVLQCTTASFSVWFGTRPSYFPPTSYEPPAGKKGPRPTEEFMPLRGQIGPKVRHSSLISDLIWVVRDEKSCAAAMREVGDKLKDVCLPWLDKVRPAEELLEFLSTKGLGNPLVEQGPDRSYLRADAGVRSCPARDEMRAHLYAATGKFKIASEIYRRVHDQRMKIHREIYNDELEDHQLLEFAELCNLGDWPYK